MKLFSHGNSLSTLNGNVLRLLNFEARYLIFNANLVQHDSNVPEI